jgi:hypothetical protein
LSQARDQGGAELIARNLAGNERDDGACCGGMEVHAGAIRPVSE